MQDAVLANVSGVKLALIGAIRIAASFGEHAPAPLPSGGNSAFL
jgi:hypothetical protein